MSVSADFPAVGKDGTHSVSEVALVASNGEETLEDITVQVALGVLGGLVTHEAEDEGICSRLDRDSGERSVEKVRVLADTLLESVGTEGGQQRQVVVIGRLAHVVHLLELLELEEVVVAAVEKSTNVTVLSKNRKYLLLVKVTSCG